MSTKIGWTDETINPIRARDKRTGEVGWFCEKVGPECKFCYAATMNMWRGNGLRYTADHAPFAEMFYEPEKMERVLGWRKPRKIFPFDMTDMFHPMVRDEWLDHIFAVIALARQHTFQLLTKRHERMHGYMNAPDTRRRVALKIMDVVAKLKPATMSIPFEHRPDSTEDDPRFWAIWPLPNAWMGVSAGDQDSADKRVPVLMQTPAAKRWVSNEPSLEGVSFWPWLSKDAPVRLDWIVWGGESGMGARPADPAWARLVADQCEASGTPLFVKQMGGVKDKREDLEDLPCDLRIRRFPA